MTIHIIRTKVTTSKNSINYHKIPPIIKKHKEKYKIYITLGISTNINEKLNPWNALKTATSNRHSYQ